MSASSSPKKPGNLISQPVDVEGEARHKRLVTLALVLTSVVVLAGGSFLAWYLTPPAMPETAEEAESVLKSARFARLSDDAKDPYYDVIRERWGMDRDLRRKWREDDELRDAARDMMRQVMGERMDAYMLAGPEERAAMMEQAGRMFGGPPRGEGREGGGRGEGGGRDPGAMRDRISDRLGNGNAQHGAAMGEIIRSRVESGGGRRGG